MTKIYLDVCCLNRTLDNLEQFRMRMEAEAVTEIIQNCEDGKWLLMNSDIIEFEVSLHSDSFKQQQVKSILNLANIYIQSTENIDLRAEELMKLSFKFHDALHLAFAEAGDADVFLTTDDRLLRKAKKFQSILNIEVENPTIWLMNVLQTEEENNETEGN
ncbi:MULTISPECIES: PIN domain-containing protein [Fischerella]|uniref:PIN domain-containing protein n=1 Tax=Fischerella muscicola CCMEE 5323 TaxID=2019572 RepID=A0A2N6K0D0_FISMU|nr:MULTISPECIES: PIN domain-containing protein [Fischerella]MBD2435126.1 PIN domain-containing protein [Fischerella sp. FACHB-380]PLZ87473.1 PIN domain-containing protein [Fischerella muscicola CCMEE 5323]PMB50505.1 PIN domain-containing protein [Fischerella thermalis CCMEE 5205]